MRVGYSPLGVTKNRLDRKVHDLRDKTILDFKTPQITKIEFIRNGKTLNLIKDEAILASFRK